MSAWLSFKTPCISSPKSKLKKGSFSSSSSFKKFLFFLFYFYFYFSRVPILIPVLVPLGGSGKNLIP
jgi:hypothetical protein